MRFSAIIILLLSSSYFLQAQKSASKWDVEIPIIHSEARPMRPDAKAVPIPFKVITSRTAKLDVVKAPAMPGLPPITGRVNVTVQMVEEPVLPGAPAPLPALPPDDPAVVARMAELRGKYRGTSLVFISATVYGHKRSLLRIHTDGGSEVTAFSNLDMNHFSGVPTYRVRDAVDGTLFDYGILMGIGNEEAATASPEMPRLPDSKEGGPAFVVMKGAVKSPATDVLEQIHDLYRKEGARMEADYHAREKDLAERRAHLLANPPRPEDVTIRFWQRDSGAAATGTPSAQ